MPDESLDPELEWVRRSWEVQPPTADFHDRVLNAYVREAERARAGYGASRKRKTTWVVSLLRLAAVTVLAGAVLLVLVNVALPQTRSTMSPPWTVDSEFLSYAEDGSSSIDLYMTSYSVNNSEIILSSVLPGSPFKTVVGRVLEGAFSTMEQRVRRSHPLRRDFITACGMGCLAVNYAGFSTAEHQWTGCVPGTVVGHERILGYPTEAREPGKPWNGPERRETLWTAPDLGCFALRVTYEEQQPDGTFRLVSEKRALRVNLKQ